MRDASTGLAEALTGSFGMRLTVDVFYDDERTIRDAPVTDWDISWNAESATKTDATLTIVYQDTGGASFTPRQFLDPLAPYGQEITVAVEVSYGTAFTERVQLGRFPIRSAPQASDAWLGFAGRAYVSGSTVQIQVTDLLDKVNRWGFRWPAIPTRTTSTWAELQYISGLTVAPNLDDKPTPTDLVYQPIQGGRLAAVQQLMSYLGGVAVTNSYGELTALPYGARTVNQTLTMGLDGRVLDVAFALDSTNLPNEVVGTYQDADGTPIYAYAYVNDGPLRLHGPYGNTTLYDTDDTVRTQAAANTRAGQVLTQALQGQTNRVTLTVIYDPRTEYGDIVTVTGPQAPEPGGGLGAPLWAVEGRVMSIRWSSASRGLMTVVLDVAAEAMGAAIHVSSP